MNANTKTEQSALAVPPATGAGALALITLSPEKYAAEVYQPFKDQLLAAIEGVRAIDYDITTTAGMATAIKCRASFRDPRTEANNEREVRKAPIIKIGKLIDSEFAAIKERAMPLEEMFDAEIKAEEKRKADVKAAKEKAEQERIDAIYAKIDDIRFQPGLALGMSVEAMKAVIERMSAIEITTEEFSTLAPQAQVALDKAIEELKGMLVGAEVTEENKRVAEAARIAEAERLAAEKIAIAAQKAKNDRIAAEQKAEAQRLADIAKAQQDAALAAQKEADAKAQAARDEQDRAAAAQQAIIDAQLKAMAEQKAALEAQQAAADARDAAAKVEREREAAHPEALMMNAEFDVARDAARAVEVERQRLQGLVDQRQRDESEPAPSVEVLMDDAEPSSEYRIITDREIIELVAEHFGLDYSMAISRLQSLDLEGARAAA